MSSASVDGDLRQLIELLEDQAAGCLVDRAHIAMLAARLADRDTDMRATLLQVRDSMIPAVDTPIP